MMQYLVTALAGVALGVVGMRLWNSRAHSGEVPASAENDPNGMPAGTGGETSGKSRKFYYAAGALVAAAIAVFALRSPDEAASPAAASGAAGMDAAAPGTNLDDVDTMIQRLASRLEKNPNNGEGFRMLGWSYMMTGHPERAIEPYRRALALLPNSAAAHAGYGEALVGAGGNTVSEEAKAQFDRAVALDPAEPRARYFLALWQAQHGQEKEALEKWIALANSGPAEAPWQTDLRRQIAQTSGKLGVDVSARLKQPAPTAAATQPPAIDPAAMQSAAALPAGQRQAMIDGMVDGLAAKLKANPRDTDRWVLLLRSRMVLKQEDQAQRDLSAARAALAGDAAALQKLEGAASELRVPGAR